MKDESEKAGLQINIKKMKIMASSPITSWQIDEETVETVSDGDCSHEVKRMLTPCKKSYNQTRQHIKKQRHYFAN